MISGRHIGIVPEPYLNPLVIVRTPYQANPEAVEEDEDGEFGQGNRDDV